MKTFAKDLIYILKISKELVKDLSKILSEASRYVKEILSIIFLKLRKKKSPVTRPATKTCFMYRSSNE